MITILMSTYNSERFLREQIDSILAQHGVEFCLLVRDDGSTDSTTSILDEYQAKGLLTWYSDDKNLGPARAFMQMLADAPESDYYAFADHDDVWLPDKLHAAEQALVRMAAAKPALYFGQTMLVDERLTPYTKQILIHPYLTLSEALMYLFIGGCTMVLNKALREAVIQYKPDYLYMHDVWIYLVALAIGANVHFDSTPHILYRQHGDNAVGQGYGWRKSLRIHYERLVMNKEHVRKRMAKEVLEGFAQQMPESNVQLVRSVAEYDSTLKNQIRLLLDKRYKCSNKKTEVLAKIAILMRTL